MTDSIITRIEALLAKAESTGYGPEADAYLAKAQELMVKHSIDSAMLRSQDDKAKASEVILVEIRTAARNSKSGPRLLSLLTVIARHNFCRTFRKGSSGLCAIVGFPEDIERVRTLYALISMQMQTEATRQMRLQPSGQGGHKFRMGFYDGYCIAVSARLEQAAASANAAAKEEYGQAGALVLRDKKALVNQHESLQNLQSQRVSAGSWSGINAGRDAGFRADIGNTRVGGQRTGLSA